MGDNSCARRLSGIHKLDTPVGQCNGCINLCWFSYPILYNNITAQSGKCPKTTPTTTVPSEAPTTTEPLSTRVTTKQENSPSTLDLPAPTDPTKRDITSSTESTQTVSTTTLEALISSTFKETNDSAINLYSTTIAQTMDTNLLATASTATPLSSPATTVNVTTKNGNAESVQGNGGVDPGVAIAVGTVCAVVFAVLIVFLLVLYRRRRQRRDKEAAGERRRSHIQPYNVSEAETDENIQDNATLESSGVRSPDVFPQDGYDVLGDVYSDRADGYLSSQDFPNMNKADNGYYEFVNDNNKSIKQDINEGRGSGYTKSDDRTTGDYNKLNNGMVGFDLNSPGHEPETYSLASTEHFKMGPGEEKEGAGHVHNRLRDGAGVPNSFPGKINNPYSFASTIDSDPVSSSLEVKEGGGVLVDKEDLDHKGQGQTPSGKTISGFVAIEDIRDTLEDDKQMDIRDDAEETNHGHVISPDQQSTILLEDDAEKESRRELTGPQSDDNNQDQMQTEYFVLGEEAKQVNGDVGNHNLPKDGERNLYFLANNGQEETEYSLANDDVVKDGGGETHQGQTMDGLVSFDLTADTYGQEGDYFMVDGDAGIDQKAPEGDGDNNDGGREDKDGGNRIPELDNRISHVYNEIPSEEDERGYMEINEVVS